MSVHGKRWFLSGLFLVCMSTLMLQIIQTRILSVVSMYYLAFIAISMAMLGMTAGALIVYFRLASVNASNLSAYLARITTAYALAIVACYLVQIASPPMLVPAATVVIVWAKILLLLAAPFTIAGIAVSLALTRSPFPVGLTYGVDLCGAAFGCLVVLGLLEMVDASTAIVVVAALAAFAGYCFDRAQSSLQPDAAAGNAADARTPGFDFALLSNPLRVVLILLVVATLNMHTRYGIQPISAKFGEVEVGGNYFYEKWNSFSRIAVRESKWLPPALWGASEAMPPQKFVDQRYLMIDGLAGTTMPRFNGNPADYEFLKYDITNLAYWARPKGKTAVIGVGSGRDMLSAYVFGSRDITGIELNPTFVEVLTEKHLLRDYAGLADLPGMRFVVDEGRSWFARTKEKFDLIEMSMIDTFAATGAGAFSLSENSLYTVEGWQTFLSALSDTGIFSVSRWHSPQAPIEVGRTTSLAVAALFALGVENPRDHIYLASTGNLATIVVSRRPLAAADIAALDEASSRLKFKILAKPGSVPTESVFTDILSAKSRADLDSRASRYLLDISAPTDSRPFFFNQLRIFDLRNVVQIWNEYRRVGSFTWGEGLVVAGNLVAMGTLFLLIGLSLAAVVFAIIMPARASINSVDRDLARNGSLYFLLIGLGFMFVEIGMIQRISVFMGHPVYALSVVLFSIILSTGIGSMLSERFSPRNRNGLAVWLGALTLYVIAMPFWLPSLTHSSLEASNLFIRSLVSVAVMAPAGILMGYGFPVGMRLVSAWDSRPTPWFWGVNGAAGVLASGMAVACSIAFSIDATLWVGAACYVALFPASVALMRGQQTAEPAAAGKAFA